MGTFIVSIILLLVIALVIRSLIKEKRSGRHPSCGGNCGSCGHACSELYPHSKEFLEKYKSSKSTQINSCRNLTHIV